MLDKQREVLAMIVKDPDAWMKNAVGVFGAKRAEEMLAAKVAKYEEAYKKQVAAGTYTTRVELEAKQELGAVDGLLPPQQIPIPAQEVTATKWDSLLQEASKIDNIPQARALIVKLILALKGADK